MNQLLQISPNSMYIIEGQTYKYNSKEYDFVNSMKFNDTEQNGSAFELLINMQDPLYSKQELFKPLEKERHKNDFRSNYVGVLYDQSGKILISLPKYTKNLIDITSKEDAISIANKHWEELKFLMEKFRSKLIKRDPLFYTCTDTAYSEFAVVKALFDWYTEYGLYNHSSQEFSYRTGRTLWGTTVNKEMPDFINNTPIYRRQIKTRYVSQENKITQLQIAILNYLYNERDYCKNFNYISNNYFFDLPEFNDVEIDIADVLNDENKKQYWINKIQYAMQMNFRDEYNELFTLLLKFLNSDYSSSMQQSGIYGIFKFDNLFEVVLSEYFGNQFNPININGKIHTQLSSNILGRKIDDINQEYYDCAKYNIGIRHEKNGKTTEKNYKYNKHKKTDNTGILIPDIIFETNYNNKQCVVIIDAKYYNYEVDEISDSIKGLPENYDVLKQYYYAKMLKTIYEKYDTKVDVINLFIMPWGRIYKRTMKKCWYHFGDITFENEKILNIFSHFDNMIDNIKKNTGTTKERRIELLNEIHFDKNIAKNVEGDKK